MNFVAFNKRGKRTGMCDHPAYLGLENKYLYIFYFVFMSISMYLQYNVLFKLL